MPAQNTLLHLVFLISTSITNVLRKFHPRVSPANLNTPSKGKRSVVVFAVLKIDKFNSVEKKLSVWLYREVKHPIEYHQKPRSIFKKQSRLLMA